MSFNFLGLLISVSDEKDSTPTKILFLVYSLVNFSYIPENELKFNYKQDDPVAWPTFRTVNLLNFRFHSFNQCYSHINICLDFTTWLHACRTQAYTYVLISIDYYHFFFP